MKKLGFGLMRLPVVREEDPTGVAGVFSQTSPKGTLYCCYQNAHDAFKSS